MNNFDSRGLQLIDLNYQPSICFDSKLPTLNLYWLTAHSLY